MDAALRDEESLCRQRTQLGPIQLPGLHRVAWLT
jgi:hypothetical protein